MSQIKIYSSGVVDKPFRELAMKRFGYGRGSISKAAEEAIYRWVADISRIEASLNKIVETAKGDDSVIAVILFGSFAGKKATFRDVDVGIIADKKYDSIKLYERYASIIGGNDMIDLSVINDLPIDVQSSALDNSEVLYSRDNDALYDYTIGIIKKSGGVKSTIKEVLSTV